MSTAAARDPKTPAEELRRLAHEPEYAGLVANNPNAPVDMLLSMAVTHPLEVATNPAIELGLVTGEVSARSLGLPALIALVRTKHAPEALLDLATDTYHQELWVTLLADPRTPATAIKRLMDQEVPAAEHHVNAPARDYGAPDEIVANAIAELSEFPQATEPLMLALRPLLPADLAIALANSASPEARLYAATSEHLPAELLARLVEDPLFEVAYAALRNPLTPASALQKGLDGQMGHRLAVSINPSLPREDLDKLLGDEDDIVAATALKNPQVTPEELRAAFTPTAYLTTLVSLGENPNTPADVLERLANDSTPVVRAAVARNRALTNALREKLEQGDDEMVRNALELNESAAPKPLRLNDHTLIQEHMPSIPTGGLVISAALRELPLKGSAPLILAHWLTTSLSSETRLLLAHNPATPAPALKHLALKDADRRVRLVATHTLEAN